MAITKAGITRRTLAAVVGLAAVGQGSKIALAEEAVLLESPRSRQGYYVAFGFHEALSYNIENGKTLDLMTGLTTTLRLGQMFMPRVGVGLNIDLGGASGDGQTASLAGLGLGGQLEVLTNLSLHASVGLGLVALSHPDDDDGELRGVVGAAYTLGLTYDWFPWKRQTGGWAVTPGVQLRAVPGDTDAYAAFLGVELTYWSGLPRNQLDLGTNEAYQRGE
jgi:hypothetical protein